MRQIIINIGDEAEDWEIDNLLEALDQNDCPMTVLVNDEVDR